MWKNFYHKDLGCVFKGFSDFKIQSIILVCDNESPLVVSVFDHMDSSLPGSSLHGIPQGRRVGSRSLLQRIFPTQGLKPGLLHFRQFLQINKIIFS